MLKRSNTNGLSCTLSLDFRCARGVQGIHGCAQSFFACTPSLRFAHQLAHLLLILGGFRHTKKTAPARGGVFAFIYFCFSIELSDS